MEVNYEFNHDIEAVAALLTDPQFLVDRCLAMGGLTAEGNATATEGGLEINTTRELKQNLPSFVAKIMGAVQHVELNEVWQQDSDGWSGNWTADITGQPITIQSDFVLKSTANGCCYIANPQSKVRIPLIGKKVEKFINGQSSDSLIADLDYTQAILDK